MAVKFVITVLVFVAVTQAIKGLPMDADQNACYLQVQPLRSEIAFAASQAGISVSSAASAINRNIALIRSNIRTEINKVQLKANQAIGPNVNLCRNSLNRELAQLNNQAFDLCYSNAEINLLRQKVNEINRLKGLAGQICSSCAFESSCVNSRIEEVRKQTQDLQAEISSEAVAIQEKSAQCAAAVESSQLEIINNASANFDACV